MSQLNPESAIDNWSAARVSPDGCGLGAAVGDDVGAGEGEKDAEGDGVGDGVGFGDTVGSGLGGLVTVGDQVGGNMQPRLTPSEKIAHTPEYIKVSDEYSLRVKDSGKVNYTR